MTRSNAAAGEEEAMVAQWEPPQERRHSAENGEQERDTDWSMDGLRKRIPRLGKQTTLARQKKRNIGETSLRFEL